MHKKAMELGREIMEKACLCGFDNLNSQDWDDFKDSMEVVEKAIKADYYYHIVEAMKKSEEEEEAEEKYMLKSLKEEYGEDEGRRYYDMWRYKSGRFAPKGRGTRRGYEEPPYYHMSPEMYREHSPEWYRDMDKASRNVMYYTEPITMNPHDHREGRSGMSRRAYMETKEAHKANTPEDKQEKMRSLEAYTKELAEDVTEMITDMTQEERALLKNKMQVLMQKI